MPFKDMFLVEGPGRPPGRIYFHTGGIDVFGGDRGQQIKGAMDYIRRAYQQAGGSRELFYQNWEFMIGALWGNNGQRVMDAFGATEAEIASKSRNPEIEGWVVREGVARRERAISCLETFGLVTAEFNLRMGSDNLLEYLRSERVQLPFVSGETHYLRL
jgi:hypothetical protein